MKRAPTSPRARRPRSTCARRLPAAGGLLLSGALTLLSCATQPPPATPTSSLPLEEVPAHAGTPQAAAADALIAQGRNDLEHGRPSDAIRALERAAELAPDTGEVNYWLAEAWERSGDLARARAFHTLAAQALGGDPDWLQPLEAQQRRLSARSPGGAVSP